MPAGSASEYMSAMAAFAGTVFALVLAARQIRGSSNADRDAMVRHYRLVDSIAVTAELAIATALGMLFLVAPSAVFTFFVGLVAVTGTVLSLRASIAYVRARSNGHLGRDRKELAQAWGNLLPIACYVTVFLYGVGVVPLESASLWGYLTAATWLTFSGCFQAVAWYARIWQEEDPLRASQSAHTNGDARHL